tara:strand:- start:324 stop:647 length:324 start_codon:yes stop_codon:yes gene_type:complete
MKKKYLFIALAMGTLVSSQSVVTDVKCDKKCIKYHQEDTKGNTIHTKDCMAMVYMNDLDPCLFDKYELTHPLFIKYNKLKEEVIKLRKIVDEQRKYIEIIEETNKIK